MSTDRFSPSYQKLFFLYTLIQITGLICLCGEVPVAPDYRMVYKVRYQYDSALQQQVSSDCGRRLGQHFLDTFQYSDTKLVYHCKEANLSKIGIKIHHSATVRLGYFLVDLETTVVFTPFNATNQTLMECVEIANASIMASQTNDNSALAIDLRTVAEITTSQLNLTVNCSDFQMEGIHLENSSWQCEENQILDESQWKCVPHFGNSSRSNTTSNSNQIQLNYRSYQSHSNVTFLTKASSLFPTQQPTNIKENSVRDSSKVKVNIEMQSRELTEGGDEVSISVQFEASRSRLCPNQTDDRSQCWLDISMFVLDTDNPAARCRRTDVRIPQVVFGRCHSRFTNDPESEPNFHAVTNNDQLCSIRIPSSIADDDHLSINNTLTIKATVDGKYDGTQERTLNISVSLRHSLIVGENTTSASDEVYANHSISIKVYDRDRKATCKSINDPHLTTFDGLEYNNYYEGEFILYQHSTLPFKVHVVYQLCTASLNASCNCAVAVQSGDDVLVVDKCRRAPLLHHQLYGTNKTINYMFVDLYLNGNLTQGTKIFQENEGKKYAIYLPHGTIVKIIINADLLNVWIIASPNDFRQTKGLCGTYDWDPSNDTMLQNGTVVDEEVVSDGQRGSPNNFNLNWRVDLYGVDSLLSGLNRISTYSPQYYCVSNGPTPKCGYAGDINYCDDMYEGSDVTNFLVHFAHVSEKAQKRNKRNGGNKIKVPDWRKAIDVNENFVSPEVYKWCNDWNSVSADKHCTDSIRNNKAGKLCSQIQSVNFKQEIDTCSEDIRITGGTDWENSARGSLKEQCLEEIRRNNSIGQSIDDQMEDVMCDCNDHGTCEKGVCQCQSGFVGFDCSHPVGQVPTVGYIPSFGLCDTSDNNARCDTVFIYGEHFLNTSSLTCHIEPCQLRGNTCQPVENRPVTTVGATLIDFNKVQCRLSSVEICRIGISNDGLNASVDKLRFIPYDSNCRTCSSREAFSAFCTDKKDICNLDGKCFPPGQKSPNDSCSVCMAHDLQYKWTKIYTEPGCVADQWWMESAPVWLIAIGAAVSGSLIGLLVGFIVYKCWCKRKSGNGQDEREDNGAAVLEEAMLHRNHGLPPLCTDQFTDIGLRLPPDDQETSDYSNDDSLENSIDVATYF